MSTLRLLAIFVENKPGQTARITKLLAEARINIRWVTIASSGPFGVMKLLVTDPERGHGILKQHGVMASLLDVLPVEVADQPGALQEVAECLARDNINLDNTSGFVANQRAIVIVETHDIERARALLVEQGLRVLTREELLGI
jgi:ACT domain-containing protein